MPKSNLQNQIKDLFYSEGFDFIGFSSCKIIDDFGYLKDWLDQKYNAEMDYMGNHKRQKPVSFLDPSFRSIISCAINYNVLENKINSHNLKKNHGWIARYAMIDDYHKILEKKLKSIAKEIEKFFKNPVRYKVYVDTGFRKRVCKRSRNRMDG
jgi:epoxyqueuosine reductase